MGWRERDWARFDDAERRAFYGAPARSGGFPSSQAVRALLLALLVSLLGGTLLAIGHLQLLRRPVGPAAPKVIYGIQGTVHALNFVPDSTGTACTEEVFTGRAWQCTSWTINYRHVPVVVPRPYNGACTHEIADQELGAWTCVDATPPPAPAARSET